jgi:serine/threonine-protein kinase HipA
MQKLEVRFEWGDGQRVVGTLAAQGRRIYFEYDAAFLASALTLSPFKLPPRPGLFEHTERDFAAVFGVFNDSLPDGWGLLLMDREFRKRGLDPGTLTPLDRLAYIGTRGMGALTYHPPATAGDDDRELGIVKNFSYLMGRDGCVAPHPRLRPGGLGRTRRTAHDGRRRRGRTSLRA